MPRLISNTPARWYFGSTEESDAYIASLFLLALINVILVFARTGHSGAAYDDLLRSVSGLF